MLTIADKTFHSRLFLGTGKFASPALMARAVEASGTELVTLALKRVELQHADSDDLVAPLDSPHIQLLPNTSGQRPPKKPSSPQSWDAKPLRRTGSSSRCTPIHAT